jgi:hypothetical protein
MNIIWFVDVGRTRAREKQREWLGEMGSPMLIGAVIAGLLIVSLFLEMVSSSPKVHQEGTNRAPGAK